MSVDETTLDIRRMVQSKRRRRGPRVKSALEIWAWSPVIILRVALLLTYASYFYFSVLAFIAGIPVFDLTTPPGYTSIWAVLLGIAAMVASVGSLSERWEQLEKWASLAVSSLYFTYVGALFLIGFISSDINRQAVAGAVLIGWILPTTRFVWLAAQSGKHKIKLPAKEDSVE